MFTALDIIVTTLHNTLIHTSTANTQKYPDHRKTSHHNSMVICCLQLLAQIQKLKLGKINYNVLLISNVLTTHYITLKYMYICVCE